MNNLEKILVVEDDLLTMKILNFILKKEGFAVSSAKDGLDAIEQYCCHSARYGDYRCYVAFEIRS